ncbi:MAG: hypothetical protein WCK32_00895 [Chlorobiaceae bacterium]
MSKKKLPEATTKVAPLSLSVGEAVTIDLSDKEHVAGVSFCPKRRMWRAYLHRGKKQVFHQWCESKGMAISRRQQAEAVFSAPGSMQEKGYPAFKRTVKPPKYRDTDRTLAHLLEDASGVITVSGEIIRTGLKGKRDPLAVTNQERIGRHIGKLFTVVDLLVMAGDVRVTDIENGMKEKVEKLKSNY